MTPLFGSNDETAAEMYLPRLHRLGVLEDGEVMCEVEGASRESNPGLVVVTDLAVHFISGGLIRPERSRLESMALEEIQSAETCESEFLRQHRYGAFAVLRARRPDDPRPRGGFLDDEPRYVE